VWRDPREALTHERGVDELARVQHHVRAMHRRVAARRIVVLEPHPALDDDRLEALAGAWAGLGFDAEQSHSSDRLHGDGVTGRDASDEHGVAAKNCNGRHHPKEQFLHTHLQLAGVFEPDDGGGAIAAP
jgi:hypothetical protein